MNIVNSILNGIVIAEASYPIDVKIVSYKTGKTAFIYRGNDHTLVQADEGLWLDNVNITPMTPEAYEAIMLDSMAKLGHEYEEVTEGDVRHLCQYYLTEETLFLANARVSTSPYVQAGCVVYKSECERYVEVLSPKRTIRTYHVDDKMMLVDLVRNTISIRESANGELSELELIKEIGIVDTFTMLYTWCNALTEE